MTEDETKRLQNELERVSGRLEAKLDKIVEQTNLTTVNIELLKQSSDALTREVREMKTNEKDTQKTLHSIESHVARVEEIGGKDLAELREVVQIVKQTKKYIFVLIAAGLTSIGRMIADLFF